MAIAIPDSISEARELRDASLKQLTEDAEKLQKNADLLRAALLDNAGTASPAVTATFAAEGQPLQIEIDKAARSRLTEDRLCTQIALALAAGPYPKALIELFIKDPECFQTAIDSMQVDSLSSFTTRDRNMKLTARHGRTVSIQAKPGSLLRLTPQEISAQVIDLATKAWNSENRRLS